MIKNLFLFFIAFFASVFYIQAAEQKVAQAPIEWRCDYFNQHLFKKNTLLALTARAIAKNIHYHKEALKKSSDDIKVLIGSQLAHDYRVTVLQACNPLYTVKFTKENYEDKFLLTPNGKYFIQRPEGAMCNVIDCTHPMQVRHWPANTCREMKSTSFYVDGSGTIVQERPACMTSYDQLDFFENNNLCLREAWSNAEVWDMSNVESPVAVLPIKKDGSSIFARKRTWAAENGILFALQGSKKIEIRKLAA